MLKSGLGEEARSLLQSAAYSLTLRDTNTARCCPSSCLSSSVTSPCHASDVTTLRRQQQTQDVIDHKRKHEPPVGVKRWHLDAVSSLFTRFFRRFFACTCSALRRGLSKRQDQVGSSCDIAPHRLCTSAPKPVRMLLVSVQFALF